MHKDEVPDFDDLRVALVDERKAVDGSAFGIAAQVDVYLRARAAGSRVAHLPEIVVTVTVDDMRDGEMFFPIRRRFVVAFEPFGGIAFKDGGIEAAGIDFQHVDEIFPGPVDGLLLEVVAKRPVPQHLKHGVVVGIQPHLFEVGVLATHAQALLGVGHAAIFGRDIAQYDVFELVHARIGKHQCGVVLDHHRGRGHNLMVFRCEKVLEGLSNFLSSKHIVRY